MSQVLGITNLEIQEFSDGQEARLNDDFQSRKVLNVQQRLQLMFDAQRMIMLFTLASIVLFN